MVSRQRTIVFSLACICMASCAHAQQSPDWNQFRGPWGNGIAVDSTLPTEFSETQNVRWKVALPGVGWSSPVAWQKQIWLTSGTNDGTQLFALCIDSETGKMLHNVEVFAVSDPSMEWSNQNPHATPTPCVEKDRVFVHYGSYGTACVSTSTGEIIWKRDDLSCNHRVGPASSPIADDNALYLQFDGVDVQYVVALAKDTGETLWKQKRKVVSDLATRLRDAGLSERAIAGTINKKPGDNRKAYGTPTLIEIDGKRQLISPGAEVLFSYNPDDGSELWRVDLTGWSWNVACRPILFEGLVYATTGIAKQMLAIDPQGQGNVTDTHVRWSARKSIPNMSSPVVVNGKLFLVTDQGGVASCLDAKTGEEIWRKRLGSTGDHWASPILSNGYLYYSSKRGVVSVINAAEEFELVAENRLNGQFIASPAVVGNALILRSTTHLYCIQQGYTRPADASLVENKTATPTNWDEAYEKLLAADAGLRNKVESGKTTKEEVIDWMKTREKSSDSSAAKTDVANKKSVELPELAGKLKQLVADGKLSEKDAIAIYKSAVSKEENNKPAKDKSNMDWDAAYEKLLKENPAVRRKVDNGGATKEQVIAWMKSKASGDTSKTTKGQPSKKGADKGKQASKANGNVNFYAIVIGRLKTKDIELGEFTMEVDHATSMYGNRWVKDAIVGKTVKVTGVSGEFLDNLLQIKRGNTLKFRSGSYLKRDGQQQLTFGPKFHVLERAKEFSPEEYGVPPQGVRGFAGNLEGKIEEIGGYEMTIRVSKATAVDSSQATDLAQAKDCLLRINGFYGSHSEYYKDLNQGDMIRVSVQHVAPSHDEFRVTELLERVK